MSHYNGPPWYQLLRYWQDRKHRHGLSFSFIVGATRSPIGNPFKNADEAIEYARDLYDEITNGVYDGFIADSHGCDRIEGPVITLQSGMRLGSVEMPDFDELWKFYGDAITAGEFSCTKGEFHRFTPQDIKWVSEALG